MGKEIFVVLIASVRSFVCLILFDFDVYVVEYGWQIIFTKILRSQENLRSFTVVKDANIWMFIMPKINQLMSQRVLFLHCLVDHILTELCWQVNVEPGLQVLLSFLSKSSKILYLHKKYQKYNSKVWTYHCFTCIKYIYLSLPELYRLFRVLFIKCGT